MGLYDVGASTHLAMEVARFWRCQVYVFGRGQEHRRLAAELGAAWTGLAQESPPHPLDASIILAPVGWIVLLAPSHLRPCGNLAINAIHISLVPELRHELLYGERTVRSVTNYTGQDAQELLRLAAQIPVRGSAEVYALEDASRALYRLKRSEVRGSAAQSIAGRG